MTPRKVRRLKLMLSTKKEASKVPRQIRPTLVDKVASILADTPSRRDDIREEPEPFQPFFWVRYFWNTRCLFSVNGDGETYLPLNLQLGAHIKVYHDIIF